MSPATQAASAAHSATTRPTSTAPATQPVRSFEQARSLLLRGEYEAAASAYVELGKLPRRGVDAACALAEIDRLLGRYEDGLARLTAIAGEGKATPAWNMAMAELLGEVGRYEEALAHAQEAVRLRRSDARARWRLAALCETLGRQEEAAQALEWFDDRMTGEPLPPDAEQMTYIGRGFLRCTARARHPDAARRTKHVLTEVYQEVTDFLDGAYWPARQAAGELMLEKYNLSGAEEEFNKIMEGNPRVADALVGLGEIALDGWDFEYAEALVERARAVNPRHVGAHLLLARTRMTERRYEDAEAAARQALATNPRSIDALSILAAAQLRRGDAHASEQTQEAVRAINARPAVLHFTLATWLAAGRQFADAEAQFKQAVEFAPWWAAPRTELGLMYMETGEEHEARRMLDAAFELDSFNKRTFNVLALLEDLGKFERLTTPNFVIRYDGRRDAVAARCAADRLERIHAEVCGAYGTTPEKDTIIEILPNHDQFSVRITGRPFIATVGACTGRVIAMTAPRGDPPFGRFNWADVLRHEFTHTVTLAATDNRIPHWLTEGLAVHQEQHPRSWAWKVMLCEALRQDRLFTLRSIDWGFMRPRRPNDRTLAYAQSHWMVEYMVERWRFEAVQALMSAFKAGKTQDQAFTDVLKCAPDAFTRDFLQWARTQVAGWGLPNDPIEPVESLLGKIDARPDDAPLWARLAEARLLAGDPKGAEQAAETALRHDANERAALELLVRMRMDRALADDDATQRLRLIRESEGLLRRLVRLDAEHPTALKYQGLRELCWEEWDEAIKWFARYQARRPDDPESYRRLAGLHLRAGRTSLALQQLERLYALTIDDPAVARQAGTLHFDQGDARAAAEWFERALDVDPYDARTHASLGAAREALRELERAEQAYKSCLELNPRGPEGYEGLARVYSLKGDADRAAENERMGRALRGTTSSAPADGP